MDARCKNCISWQLHKDDWGKVWRECNAAEGGDLCLMSGEEFGVFADASDDTGLRSAFITGPEFGCVKFESIEGSEVMAFPKLYGFNDVGLCVWEHQCSENDMGPGGPFIDGCGPHPLTKTIKVFGEFKFWQRCGSGLWCRVFSEAPSGHLNAFVGSQEVISKIINHK